MPNTAQRTGKTTLLSTAYFAPVQYYSKILSVGLGVVVERHENFNKQSYRNRCTIYTANGLLDLIVPVAKSEKTKVPVTEVEISYDTPWQKQHFKAIESAYRRSPFFEYYIDELMMFFDRRHRYLYDLNMNILQTVCNLTDIPFRIQESDAYRKPTDCKGIIDLRNKIHPKVTTTQTDTYVRYTQVFADRWGFKPNLSILDLLFNTGPEAKSLI